jgi:hypothetical protein
MCANVSPFVHSVHGNPNFNPTKLGARQTQIMVFIIIIIIIDVIIVVVINTYFIFFLIYLKLNSHFSHNRANLELQNLRNLPTNH